MQVLKETIICWCAGKHLFFTVFFLVFEWNMLFLWHIEGVGVSKGHCPVCRKVFYAMDFEHIPGFVASHLSQSVCPLNLKSQHVCRNSAWLTCSHSTLLLFNRWNYGSVLRILFSLALFSLVHWRLKLGKL